MAYLNLRERRVEATIAYIGALGTGRSTNLEMLGASKAPGSSTKLHALEGGGGDVLALDWALPSDVRFRDCGLLVKLLAARGPLSAEHTRAMVRSADGVVIVVDASPDAADDNRASVDAVREALAEARRDGVPVVVQVNKTDAPGAVPAADVVRASGGAWPHVPASALRGEGVVETLERALEDVVEHLRADERLASASEGNAPAPQGLRAEGNPLLTALKQVLRDTVAEHVAALEARFFERMAAELDRRLASPARPHAPDDTASAEGDAAVAARLERLEGLVRESAEAARGNADRSVAATRALSDRIDELQRREKKGWFR